MFRNIVSLIEKVDDVDDNASYPSSSIHSGPVTRSATEVNESLDVPVVVRVGSPIAAHEADVVNPTSLVLSPSHIAVSEEVHPEASVCPTLEEFTAAAAGPIPPSFSRQLGEATFARDELQRRCVSLEQEVSGMIADLARRNALLLNLASSVESFASRCSASPGDFEQMQQQMCTLACEAMVVVGGRTQEAVTQVQQQQEFDWERVARASQDTINVLREENISLRSSLVDVSLRVAHHAEQHDAISTQLHAAVVRVTELSVENEKRKEDALHWRNKVSSLNAALHAATEKIGTSAHAIDSLTALLSEREQEIALLQQKSATSPMDFDGARSVASTAAFRAVERRWYGPVVQRSASVLDSISLRFGRLLHRHAWLRVLFVVYLLVLHIHSFHVVSLIAHDMPHVGDDVHDHLRNHLK